MPSFRLHDLIRRLHRHSRSPEYWAEHPDQAMAFHFALALLAAGFALLTIVLVSDALSHF